jgi:hypothetical protein
MFHLYFTCGTFLFDLSVLLCDASVGDRQSLLASRSGRTVAVAATILWFVAFLMSCLFAEGLADGPGPVDGELRSESKNGRRIDRDSWPSRPCRRNDINKKNENSNNNDEPMNIRGW